MNRRKHIIQLFPLSLFVVLVLILTACDIASQADIGTQNGDVVPLTTEAPATTTETANSEPDVFSVSSLTIEPRTPATGAFFSVSVTVTNFGGSQGGYDAILVIDEILIDDNDNVTILSTKNFNKTVIVAAGQSETITFDSLGLQDGLYLISLDDLVDYVEIGC